jgi:nucleoside-diphosphate-sugar epimerase
VLQKTNTLLSPAMFPTHFADVEALEDFMTTPSQALVDDLKRLDGDIVVLGVAGKMGVTLAGLAKRAAPGKRIIGVSRFSDKEEKQKLESWGVETIVCDLLDRAQVAKLPKLPNVVFMAGKKFGTEGAEDFTWAMNTYAPALVGEHFSTSRIVAFSTILVYPYVNVLHQGSLEADPPHAMPGEYANSCVGRERIFQYFTRKHGTAGRNIRLCYSIDMRYGVLAEVAHHVLNGEVIDLSTGHANVIWQGDANSQILRSLLHCETPASPINITGPEAMSIRALATAYGKIFGKEPKFTGEEQRCVFVNGNEAAELFGYPVVSLPWMIKWTADWVSRGQLDYDKPCHYETRDGVF